MVDNKSTDAEIAKYFREKYHNLYNSVEDNTFDTVVQNVSKHVNEQCNTGSCTKSYCHNITPEMVRNAITSLNKGKDDEVYEITSDHFINATELAFFKLSQLLTCMLRHGCSSQNVNKSIIKPIPKNKQKSFSDSN